MTRRSSFLAAIKVVVIFGLLSGFPSAWITASENPGPNWRVGVARQVITPPAGQWMAGYASRQRPAEGKLHDLWLKVLVLEDQAGHRGVFISADILGFPRHVSEKICQELCQKFGLERDQIMLAASHTHCGPVLENALYDIYPLDNAQKELIARYTRQLEQWAVTAVERAIQSLRPATLSAFESEAHFAVNRRNNKEGEVPSLLARGERPRGPVNHRVPGFWVTDISGNPVAVVFGYACHATTLDIYQWCGDYPGFAQLSIEKALPGVTAMFFAGCGADQNPIPRRSVELCEKYGEQLASAVLSTWGKSNSLAPKLCTAFTTVDLRFDLVDDATLNRAVQSGGYQARWANRLLSEKAAGKQWTDTYPYPVQVWRLGEDQYWVALGGEVVVDYANIMEKSISPTIWVTGYANDVMAYIPSRRVWEEGGYESGAFPVYGLPAARWEPNIEHRILAAVQSLIAKLKVAEPASEQVAAPSHGR
ncbi:neutral/alkaline non-lysosomal ceramidase N-terminal domain-containing protein [Thermogutta sp.]|uniref:neutral/alkaline non-lysosomal ceramidase N-terminal domain-containing protein n=1 Tax=Thermogutta sp. TaxID=1962930 RepID=UPI003C7BEDB6